jgi:hypothetical protein
MGSVLHDLFFEDDLQSHNRMSKGEAVAFQDYRILGLERLEMEKRDLAHETVNHGIPHVQLIL